MPITIVKEDFFKWKHLEKKNFTCQEYMEVTKYKTQQILKGKKYPQNYQLGLYWFFHNEKTATFSLIIKSTKVRTKIRDKNDLLESPDL